MRNLVLLALLAGACAKNNPAGAGGAQPTANVDASAASMAPYSFDAAVAAAAAPPLSCDKLIPKELAAKDFDGAEIKGETSTSSVTCMAIAGSKVMMALYTCTGESEEVLKKTMETGQRMMKGSRAADVGRMAYQNDQMLQFLDDDTPCYVTMNGFGDKSLAVARDLAAALTPAAMK